MCLGSVFLLCLSQIAFGRVLTQDKTENHEEASSANNKEQWTLTGHARGTREVLGDILTLNNLPNNMTHLVEDPGKYYTWHSYGLGDSRTHKLWVNMSDLQHGQVRMHGILSNAHRQAAKVALSFDFPFYGHYLRQITIATGGFIFMGDVTHRMLTAAQYIAPLMANFDPSYSKESTVQYLDNGELFVVQWEKVRLQGRESEGAYTFQVTLHRKGTIIFSYRDIPQSVEVISSAEHPVKIGLSDAFLILLPSPQSPGQSADEQHQAIYEYHRVEIDITKITNQSAFEFTPLPTCLQHDSCELCTLSNITSGCSWCNVLQRCSDGMDRHRQEWLDYACSVEAKDVTCEDYSRGASASSIDPSTAQDPVATSPLSPRKEGGFEGDDYTQPNFVCNDNDRKADPSHQRGGSTHTGVIAGVVAAVLLLFALACIALYIKSHPSTASPLYLIERHKNCQSRYTEVEGNEEEGPC